MSATGHRQRLAAILAADVAGYSRLMAADEHATVTALDKSRGVIRTQVESRQGRVIDMAGDSVLAIFDTAGGAVAAALAMQEELDTLNVDVPADRRMRFRIGVHLGDVIEKADGSIYGDGVNIAARLETLAAAGGITVSDAVQGAVRGRVDATFADQGDLKAKNMLHAVRAFAVIPGIARPAPMGTDSRLTLPDRPSIAVLPFTNMSGDPGQEYFADGMVEDIITELSRFQRLFVIARNTSFTYKGRSVDVRRVAQELGVHFVLEGSVRKIGDRVRVNAQLINGDSGQHVWAERYEDVVSDVFELQERITRQVVASMVPEIEAEEMRMLDRGKRFSEADDIAWRAAKASDDGSSQGDSAKIDESISLAEEAIAMNKNCQLAWAVLASGHCWRIFLAWTRDRKADLQAARRAADKLMQLGPNDSRSYYFRGVVESLAGEFANSVADLRKAQELNPNDAPPQFFLSQLQASDGQVESAKALAAQATRISPKDRWVSTAHLAMAKCAFIEGDMPALFEWSALAIQRQPFHPLRRVLMIVYAANAEDRALLRENLEKLQGFAPDFIPSLFRDEIQPFRKPEHMKLLLDGLRKAGLSG